MPFNPFDTDSPPQLCKALPPTTGAADIGTKPYCTWELPYHLMGLPQPPTWQLNIHSQPSGFIWQYCPVLGYTHTLGACSICSVYTHHVVASLDQADASLNKAMRIGQEHQDIFFMDGFRQGVRSNITEVTRLKEQLDTAKLAFENCVSEKNSLRFELDQVKLKLLRMEEQPWEIGHSLLGQNSPISSLSPPSLSSSRGTQSPGSSIGLTMELPHNRVHPIHCVTSLTTEKKGIHSRPVRQLSATYASVASTDISQNSHIYNVTSHSLPIATWTKPKAPSTPPVARNYPCNKYPRTIEEVKGLMDLAHQRTPEGIEALSIMKRICSLAHGTPGDSKSAMQQWILINWRKPHAAPACEGGKPHPRLCDPVYVWYDHLCAHPHSMPRGVRKDALGRPVNSDLIASRAVARMRPTESAVMRNDFISHVTDMFAVPGMYKNLLVKNNFVVACEVTYSTFSGIITPDTISRHFADSGFTPEDAKCNFEPWAKNYKECRPSRRDGVTV